MATEIKLRRGTTAQHATFTGAEGEITVDTDKETVVVHDGSTEGGYPLPTFSDLSGITGKFVWDSSTTSPAAAENNAPSADLIRNLHDRMRGCLLNDNGTVNYYLQATDWTKKQDGTASDLTGPDGQVMVEVPKFWYRISREGSLYTYEVATTPLADFAVHPAFIKNGVEVDKRYYSAYDACVFDASASAYISGLNLDENIGNVDLATDTLASVKGVYPMVGLERDEFRALAANRGSGWRQLDFTLWSAIQLLFVVEYQTFFSQDVLGDGNVNGSYIGSSSNQNDSPHTIAGAGDSWANDSTDGSQPSAGAKPGTAYMKYRGIENIYGNCWNFSDGINVNVGGTGNVHITNDDSDFADDTSTNMELLTDSLTTGSNYIDDLVDADWGFLASSTSGSSTTYITDRHYGSSSSNRVVSVGGYADVGSNAGLFCLGAGIDSSFANRYVGARLVY